MIEKLDIDKLNEEVQVALVEGLERTFGLDSAAAEKTINETLEIVKRAEGNLDKAFGFREKFEPGQKTVPERLEARLEHRVVLAMLIMLSACENKNQ